MKFLQVLLSFPLRINSLWASYCTLFLARWMRPSKQFFLMELIFWGYANDKAKTAFVIVFFIWSRLSQKRLHHSHYNGKRLKPHQKYFHKRNRHYKQPFSLFWCIPCATTSKIPSSSKNIINTAFVSWLYFCFLWLW